MQAVYNDDVILLYILLGAANLFWLISMIHAVLALRRTAYLPDGGAPASLPKISILVPARNESRNLRRSVESLLAQNYPDLEILVVDDHSEDDTYAIAESMARQDPRVKVMRSAALPPDWRGKSWAMHQAAASATGNWLLLTDADVVHHPGILKTALAVAQKEKVDLLSILPHVECISFWERVVLPTFAIILSMIRPVYRSNDPDSSVALAAGGFILVKSLLFRHLDGFHLIREAVAEDVKLAELFKSSGYRIKTFVTREPRVSTRMYESFAGVWEGLSRHAYEGAGYNAGRVLLAVLTGYALMVAPVLLLAAGIALRNPALAALCAFPTAAMFGGQTLANRHFHVPLYYFFSFPLAAALYGLIMLHSMVSHDLGRGNAWKGRRYRKEDKVA